MELILYPLAAYGVWSGYRNIVAWHRRRRLLKLVNGIWSDVVAHGNVVVPVRPPRSKPKLVLLEGGKELANIKNHDNLPPPPPAPPAPNNAA